MNTDVFNNIKHEVANIVQDSCDNFGVLVFKTTRESFLDLVGVLKDKFKYDLFLDVTAVDYPEREYRFEVVYHFYSTVLKNRVRIKISVKESDPVVPTLRNLYA